MQRGTADFPHASPTVTAAAAAAASVAAVTTRIRATGTSSVRALCGTLHSGGSALHHCSLDHSLCHGLQNWLDFGLHHGLCFGLCTSNSRKLCSGQSAIGGVGATASSTAVAASADGAAVQT